MKVEKYLSRDDIKKSIKTISLMLALFFTLTGFATTPAHTVKKLHEALTQINLGMHADYAFARLQAAKKVSPLIMLVDGVLSFYRDGVLVDSAASSNMTIDILKNIDHIVLRIYVIYSLVDKNLQVEQQRRWTQLEQQLKALEPELKALPFDSEQRARQIIIVKKSLNLLQTLSSEHKRQVQQFEDYFLTIRPLILLNISDAAKTQVLLYQHVTSSWLKQMTKQETKHLLLVVGGGMMAHHDSLEMQFFAHALHTTVKDKRLLYLDEQFTRQQMMPLIGTYVLDTQMGLDMFAEKWRMHRDIRAGVSSKSLQVIDVH